MPTQAVGHRGGPDPERLTRRQSDQGPGPGATYCPPSSGCPALARGLRQACRSGVVPGLVWVLRPRRATFSECFCCVFGLFSCVFGAEKHPKNSLTTTFFGATTHAKTHKNIRKRVVARNNAGHHVFSDVGSLKNVCWLTEKRCCSNVVGLFFGSQKTFRKHSRSWCFAATTTVFT